jgi:hypothetical protein
VDEPTEPAWWYQRDERDDLLRDDRSVAPAPNQAPSLPTPTRAPQPPDQDVPNPGRAAPGRHGWARSDGVYVPSVADRGATKSIVLGAIGLLICGVILGPAAIVEGVQARRRIASSGGGLTGNAQAIIGICLGSIATFFTFLGYLAIVVRAMAT